MPSTSVAVALAWPVAYHGPSIGAAAVDVKSTASTALRTGALWFSSSSWVGVSVLSSISRLARAVHAPGLSAASTVGVPAAAHVMMM